jgi:hypothetical protein
MQMGARFSDLLKTMSLRSLFSGVSAPIYGAMPSWAAGYWGYNFGKQLESWLNPRSASKQVGARVSAPEVLIGGVTSGMLVSIVKCPTDVVKIRCQNQGERPTVIAFC